MRNNLFMEADSNRKQKAFLDLINRNKARMVMICRSYASESDTIDDLMQDAIVRLWDGFDSYRSEADIATWLYRVTLNSCIDSTRRRRRRPVTVPLVNIDVLDDDVGSSQQTARLYSLVKQLEPFDRALVLLWLESLNYAEIGAIMGMTPKNVSVRLFRIRAKLKNLTSATK